MSPITGLDLAGFTAVPDRPDCWVDAAGTIIAVHAFDLVPDLPAGLDDLAALRSALTRGAAEDGVAMIEIDVVELGGLPAVRQVAKARIPGREHGLVFLGSYTVPRADRSVVLKVQAAESGTTGMREALVMNERLASGADLGDLFPPHPYAPDAEHPLPYNPADAPEWDARFPDHPLSLVRTALDRHNGIGFTPDFHAAAPFAPQPPTAEHRWSRRR